MFPMSLDPETAQIGRERITRIFRYLEALNQHRNPAKRQISEQPWVLWLRNLPVHPSIRQATFDERPNGEAEIETRQQQATDNFVLKVRRPVLTRVPLPPEAITDWLEQGWDNPASEVRVLQSRNETNDEGATLLVRFEDDLQRPKLFEGWKAHRDEWSRNERPAREAMKIFEQFYELYGRVEREAERVEPILGDGILSWRRQEGGVYHPVLLQRVQLEFDPNIPEFTILETEHETELYSALFRSMPDVDGRTIARCRQELDQGEYHPLGGDATSGFLRRFLVQLSPRGEFLAQSAPRAESEEPTIGRDPVLFLRLRTLGFTTAIEGVLEDLPTRENLPPSLLGIAGVEFPSEAGRTLESAPSGESEVETGDILLSKPANPEQIQIAERLERHGAVLVQGPPGTGKTHTIANLVGHLLAQGKSILITAHTTKALRVLREKVTEQLQPLCVSVLESDTKSQDQLKSSIEAIVERLARSDAHQLETEAQTLATRRQMLLTELRKARQNLFEARANEYRDIVVAGQIYRPSEAARQVAREKDLHNWIPTPILLGAPLPLSEAEITDLYHTNVTVSAEDESELSRPLSEPSALLTPEEFEALLQARTRLTELDLTLRADLWDRPPAAEEASTIETLTTRARQAVSKVSQIQGWEPMIITAGWQGKPHREPWDHLLTIIDNVCREAARAQESLFRYDPTLSEQLSLEEQQRIINEILQHLEVGKKLTWKTLLTRRTWKRFLQEVKVATGEPSRIEHFQALQVLVSLQISRRNLLGRWDRQLAALGGVPTAADLGRQPERVCAQFSEPIQSCLSWHANEWNPIECELINLGFRWSAFLAEQPTTPSLYGELLRLRDAVVGPLQAILTARVNASYWQAMEVKLKTLTRTLALSRSESSAGVVTQLQEAVRRLDPRAYQEAFQQLVELHGLRTELERRRAFLQRLDQVAPAWSTAVHERSGIHGRKEVPGNISAAWLWRQLHDELEQRSRTSRKDLQQTIKQLNVELQRTTTDLIDRRAWAFQVRRTTRSQRQSLIGWLDTVRKIGKGYGKRTLRLRGEASRRMNESRSAVPVWIMPLARVAENFNPRTTRFDVVIIDEASQSDVMALLALYMTRQVVVVGDHEQVSPSAVGQELDVVQHLIDEHLQGIPNAVLYDGQMSVYDLARQSFGGTIALLEHFRCVPEIIQFSNHLSYEGKLKPLRDPSLVQLKPHVISYRVSGASTDNKINMEEAQTIASLLVAAIEQPEYAGKTFGVISLVGEEQAFEIDRLLQSHLSPHEYERRRILCGNAAHFQGDERDVMFLSVVDTSQEGPLSLRQQPMFKQRFNVATSRARDQMWVVHSLDPQSHLKSGDLRRRLIEHAEDPLAVVRTLETAERLAESEFERAAMQRLIQAGYRVDPQRKIGAYRIDIVVMDSKGRRLAVECDGDRFHPIEKLPEDMERQAILERLGWTFVRIRGSQFFRDPDAAMRPVFESLSRLGISPESPDLVTTKEPDSSSEELKQRVIRRAHELLRRWQEEEEQPLSEKLMHASEVENSSRTIESHNRYRPGVRRQGTRPSVNRSGAQVDMPQENSDIREDHVPYGIKTKPEEKVDQPLLPFSLVTPAPEKGDKTALNLAQQESHPLETRAREVVRTKGQTSFTNHERKAIREALGSSSYAWSDRKLAETFIKNKQQADPRDGA